MEEKKIRIGIIGCGGIANSKHMPSLSKQPDVELEAFCDIMEERAQKARQDFGTEDANVYTDYRELLKDECIDIVHVCTPNREHSFITVDALEAGKYVMCEKPMAINGKEAQKMLDAARRTGRKLTIGYQNRYRPDAWYLKRACDAGELGEIYYDKAHALLRRGVPTWGVFIDEYEQGGGPLIDIGTHALDLTLWMMDNYKPHLVVGSVFRKLGGQKETGNSYGDWDPDKITVEDSAFGFIVMENGATILLESSWALNTLDIGEAKTSLCGIKAGADMKDGLRINRVKYNKWVTEQVTPDSTVITSYGVKVEKPSDVEARMWLDAVKNHTDVVVKPEQAIVVTRILDAIYRSGRTGKPVIFGKNGLPEE
ncbi:Gfo/Idh/MocA family protein [Acutalibacter caecimuris]|uniref:Gfo/Idh/MocA family protein n=1 Tax=Acutalibacter caecimuris TaxID=3093657 RepID=UPI002AC8D4BD|nr:Gfo/Idh/MocA family oxidoreductase [Acutalibacter sp. M00118]